MNKREDILKEVREKWFILPPLEFNKWLNEQINNTPKEVYKENWNPDWKGDPDDPNRWNGW